MAIFLAFTTSIPLMAGLVSRVQATPTYTLTEWTVPTSNSLPVSLALSPSGTCCWFAESSANKLAYFNSGTGTFQEWQIPTANSGTVGIVTTTMSGQTAVWGAEYNTGKIFVFFPSTGMFKEYAIPGPGTPNPEYVAVEPPGVNTNVWFGYFTSNPDGNRNGEIIYNGSPTPTFHEDSFPSAEGTYTNGLFAAAGAVYFAGTTGIAKLSGGQYTIWPLPTHGTSQGAFVTLDPLGQVWYSQTTPSSGSSTDNYVGVVRGDNTIKEWQIPTPGADPRVISFNPITSHPWVGESGSTSGNGKLAELDPSAGGTSYPDSHITAAAAPSTTTVSEVNSGPYSPSTATPTPTTSTISSSVTGQFTEYSLASGSNPHDVIIDSSGTTWVLEAGTDKIGKLSATTPDFTIAPTLPTVTIPQGASATVTITATSQQGFSGPVTLSVTGSVPTGVTFSTFNPNPVSVPSGGSASATLTVNVAASAALGTNTITVSGIGSSGTHTTSFQLTVTSGADFAIALSSPTLSIAAGGSSTETVTITSIGSFNAPVNLSYGSLPSGVHISFSTTPVTPPAGGTVTSTATVSVDSGTPASTSSITITGTSGSLTHSQVFTLTITVSPDFSITGNPLAVSVTTGGSSTSTITIQSINGFNSAVALSYSWIGTAPTGISISIPGPVTPSTGTPATSTLTISATAASSTGLFTLQVTGTSGALSHSVNVGIQVTAPATTSSSATSTTSSSTGAPVCLIATATYGSQMAPEVQLLRNFRDNSIMKTRAGASFMIVFNAWYYSFSPGVANYLSSHWLERTVMKVVLYPLVGILDLTSRVYKATSADPELAVLISGMVASSLIGAFYLGIPFSLIRSRVRKLRALDRVEKYLAFAVMGGILALTMAEALPSQTLLMGSSTAIVLATLSLATLTVSGRIARKL